MNNLKVLRRKEVSERIGLKHTALYELIKRGEFPKPIKLSARSVGWLESDVEAWIKSKIDHRETEQTTKPEQLLWTEINKTLNARQRAKANSLLYELHGIRRALIEHTRMEKGPLFEISQRLQALTRKFPNHLEG